MAAKDRGGPRDDSTHETGLIEFFEGGGDPDDHCRHRSSVYSWLGRDTRLHIRNLLDETHSELANGAELLPRFTHPSTDGAECLIEHDFPVRTPDPYMKEQWHSAHFARRVSGYGPTMSSIAHAMRSRKSTTPNTSAEWIGQGRP